MSILLALIIGAAVGGIGGYLLLENIDYLLLNVLCGLAGSIFGLVVYAFFLRQTVSSSLFDPLGALSDVIGAFVFVLSFTGVHRFTAKHFASAHDTEDTTIDLDKMHKP